MSQNIDSKREEFRKYLEASGVMDTLTHIFCELNDQEERPKDALEFMREKFLKGNPQYTEMLLQKEYVQKKLARLDEVECQLAEAKAKLEKYEKSGKGEGGNVPKNP